MQVGSVIVQIGADLRNFASGLRTALNESHTAASRMERDFQNAFGQIDRNGANAAGRLARHFREVGRIVSGILISQAFYNSMNDIQDATKAVFEFSMTLEDAQVKWTSLLGSADEAKKWIVAMQDFAQKTPFDFAQVDASAAKIRMMGVEAKQVLPILETLGNAVAINGGDSLMLERMTTVLRQMWQSPTVQKQDINQLIQGGQIDAVKYLNQELGLTAKQVQNIGKAGVSGKEAAIAILKGIAKDPAYANGMKKLSENTRGMMESIKEGFKFLGSLTIAPVYEKISRAIRTVRDVLDGMIDTFRDKGLGGIFEQFIPKDLQPQIRMILASVKSFWDSVIMIFKALKPAFESFGKLFLQSFAILLPIIAGLARSFANFLQYLQPIMPLIGRLAFALTALFIASTISVFFMVLARALKTFAISLGVVEAVISLGKALRGLWLLLAAPEVLAILAIGAAIFYIAMQSKTASEWVSNLLGRLAQLMGIDPSNILKAFDNPDDGMGKYIKDMRQDLLDVIGDAGGVGAEMDKNKKKTEEAKKAMDKYLESFDEVFQVPDKQDSGAGPGGVAGTGGGSGGGTGGSGKGGGGASGSWGNGSGIDPKNFPPLMKNFRDFKINISWKWNPGPPGAAATAWVTSMDKIRQSIKDFNLNPATVNIKNFSMALADVLKAIQLMNVGSQAAATLGVNWDNIFNQLGRTIGDFGINVKGVFDGIKGAVEGANPSVKDFGENLGGIVDKLIPSFTPLGRLVGDFGINFKDVFGSLGETVGDFAINVKKGFDRLADTVGSLNLGPAILNAIVNPIGWIDVAFKLLPEGAKESLQNMAKTIETKSKEVVDSVKQSVTDQLKEWQTGYDQFKTKAEKSLDNVKQSWDKYSPIFAGAVKATWANKMKEWDKGWEDLKTKAKNGLESIKKAWEDSKTPIGIAVAAVIAAIVAIFAGLPAVLGSWALTAGTTVADKLGLLTPKAKEALKNLPDTLLKPFSDLPAGVDKIITTIVKGFKALPETIKEGIKNIPDIFKEAFGNIKVPSFAMMATATAATMVATFKMLRNISGFANGGIIGSDSIIRVGEKGRREAVVPLQNASAMAPFADAVAARLGGTGGGQQVLYVGNLIADERSLRELERKMQVIRLNEAGRGGVKR